MAFPGVRIVLGVGLHDQSGRSSCIIVPLRWKIKLCSRDTMEAMEAGLPEPWPEIFGSSRVFCLVSGVLGWILYYCFLQSQRGREPPQLRPKELGVGLPGSRTKTFFFISVGHIDRVASGPGAPHRGAGARGRGPGARGRGAELGVEVGSRWRVGVVEVPELVFFCSAQVVR